MAIKVDIIDDLEAVDRVWPTADVWSAHNLVGADIGLAGAISAEAVKDVLPTLGRLNYQVYATVNGRVGALYVNYRGFKFQRGAEMVQLTAAEQRLKEAQEIVKNYTEQAKGHAATVARFKELVGKNNEGARDLAEVKATVMEWENVLDFTYGPANDPLTDTYIDQGSFVATFMPVIFSNGARRRLNPPAPEDAFMVTTPIRLSVSEAGTITSIGSKSGNTNFHTHHPHIRIGGVCLGNLTEALKGPLQENNIIAAMDLMREWRIAENAHEYEAQWATRSAQWWAWFTNPSMAGNAQRNRFLFNGKWDGRTVQVSAPRPTYTTIEDFFGGPIDKFNHVASLTVVNFNQWPTKTLVKAYSEFNPEGQATCTFCQKGATGCPCHGQICTPCGNMVEGCSCPIKFAEPTVLEFRVNDVQYQHEQLHPKWRNFNREVAQRLRQPYMCDAMIGEAAHPALWRRLAVARPAHICQEHLNKGAKEAYAVALRKATEEFNRVEGVVTG